MPTFREHRQPIKELKVGGLNSERIVPPGGSTILKISVKEIFSTLTMNLKASVFGYAFLVSSKKTWTT